MATREPCRREIQRCYRSRDYEMYFWLLWVFPSGEKHLNTCSHTAVDCMANESDQKFPTHFSEDKLATPGDSMPLNPPQSDLERYLDEDLPAEEMTQIEKLLRDNPKLMAKLERLIEQRDAGVHSFAAIWRRDRLSCPDREQLGSYLLGAMPDDRRSYVKFHLEKIGCQICQASLDDLKQQQEESAEDSAGRRQKYFQSSAGYLRK